MKRFLRRVWRISAAVRSCAKEFIRLGISADIAHSDFRMYGLAEKSYHADTVLSCLTVELA